MAKSRPTSDAALSRRQVVAMLAAGALALPRSARSQELRLLPPVAPTLDVLLLNTHLLPGIAQTIAGHRGQADYRVQAIASQLHGHDVVGLCEVFEARRRDEILNIVAQNSQAAFKSVASPPASGRHLIGGGLLLLTRLQLVGEPHFITYSKASRLLTRGFKADGFAAKGAIHARLRLRDDHGVLDCFLTHLESVSQKARAAQIAELAAFIAEYSSTERPAILMGDMNVLADYPVHVSSGESEYRLLRDSLRYGNETFIDLWPQLRPDCGGTRDALAGGDCHRIDYIFASPRPAQCRIVLEPTAIALEPFLDQKIKEGSLSDHAGLQCTLAICKR
jgi:endonuclease/exonuclease/phosphatase family metal-dependent hydrolase